MTDKKDLAFYINNNMALNQTQIDSLVDLVSDGCLKDTKRLLKMILTYELNTLSGYSFNRVFVTDICEYIAGWDYDREIINLRKAILGELQD